MELVRALYHRPQLVSLERGDELPNSVMLAIEGFDLSS
jgi:hypothetical protein